MLRAYLNAELVDAAVKPIATERNGANVPARAEVIGQGVVVSTLQVSNPVVFHYGWTNVPVVNLYNGVRLPASPFRTDTE